MARIPLLCAESACWLVLKKKTFQVIFHSNVNTFSFWEGNQLVERVLRNATNNTRRSGSSLNEMATELTDGQEKGKDCRLVITSYNGGNNRKLVLTCACFSLSTPVSSSAGWNDGVSQDFLKTRSLIFYLKTHPSTFMSRYERISIFKINYCLCKRAFAI